ncbi:MAG: hypothetical protein JKY26_17610 [Pseudomonas sp.]|nr:hypothetical protein [Pseudomonas sp.]
MITPDKMTNRITLHGLGFIQVQLEADQRLHVWHPELPRRSCFEHSAIHNHRFNFVSKVLVGTQINIDYAVTKDPDGSHIRYLHEGPRTANGGRPWVNDGFVHINQVRINDIPAGSEYFIWAHHFHRTEPGGSGKVATLMKKCGESDNGAHSLCLAGYEPDADFDRFQWSEQQLWEVVQDVLLGAHL